MSACGGDDDDDSGPSADAAAGGPDAVRADARSLDAFPGNTDDTSGHFHTFTVQCADLTETQATYTASGSGHNHTITLNSLELANLAAGDTVAFNTSDGHAHSWTVTKPAMAC